MHDVSETASSKRSLLGGTAKGVDGTLIPIPRTVAFASIAMVITAVLNVIQAAILRSPTAQMIASAIKNNKTAKKPRSPYGAAQVIHDAHSMFTFSLLYGAVMVILAFLLRNGRMAHTARWLAIVILVITGAPTRFLPNSDYPSIANVLGIGIAAASIAAIALMFLTPSREFFAATKAATGKPSLFGAKGAAAAGAGAPAARPASGGLFGKLFAPPPPRGGAAPAATANPAAGRSNAKVRASDAKAANDAAVAKGAELARERAKASKSKSRKSV